MEIAFIYSLIDPITNEIKYIGKADKPFKRYKSHIRIKNTKKRKDAWIKSLLDQGLKPKVEIIDEIPETEWKFWEKYWISQFLTWGFNLYNLTEGGEGVKKGTAPWNKGLTKENNESLFQRSLKQIGQNLSEETKQKIREKRKLQIITPETKLKKSINAKGKKLPFMRNLTDEQIKLLRNKGNWQKGNIPWNKDKKGYISKKAKTVLQYNLSGELIKEWRCAIDAANELNICSELIANCCRNKRENYKNYIWKYKK